MPAMHHKLVRIALGCALAQLLALSMLTTAVGASFIVVPYSMAHATDTEPGATVVRYATRVQRANRR